MAEKGMCQHGLAWYLFFRMQGRILHLNKIASDQVQRMEAARTESLDFPAEDFAVIIPDFLKRLDTFSVLKHRFKTEDAYRVRKSAHVRICSLMRFRTACGLLKHTHQRWACFKTESV